MDKSVENEQPNKIRKRFNKILDIVIIVFGVIAIIVSGLFLFQNLYFEPFYVNGQSMYPTFNANALSPSGAELGEEGGQAYDGCNHIDYGFMNCRDKVLDNLQRFDIIVTYSTSEKHVQLIKRLIGLPGETIKFTATNPDDPENGDLYVKKDGEFVLVEQPIENKYKVSNLSHPYNAEEIVLGDDEYYVLGDNRGHSQDSRFYGKMKRDWLVGKVIYLAGYCTIKTGKDGHDKPTKIRYRWPRFVK